MTTISTRHPPPSIEEGARAPPAAHIYWGAGVATPQPQEVARDTNAARPGHRSFYSLSFSVRLSLADAVALRLMRAPPCRAASWPRSGRRPRRRSWPMTRTRRSTWSARGAAAAPRPPPPRRGLRPAIPSPRSSTTVSRFTLLLCPQPFIGKRHDSQGHYYVSRSFTFSFTNARSLFMSKLFLHWLFLRLLFIKRILKSLFLQCACEFNFSFVIN